MKRYIVVFCGEAWGGEGREKGEVRNVIKVELS